ncbi:GntR family transcriptional regulator [Streptomyces sp. NPDC055186]
MSADRPKNSQRGRALRLPKYVAIAAELEARIRSGQYEAGQALPSQRDLSTEFGVTLMTLRQALDLLAERGLVSSHAGRGTYVSPLKAVYRMGPLRSLSDELRDQGHTVDTVVLSRRIRRMPRWVARRLRLDGTDDAAALRIERLRLLSGIPVVHQVSWVPGSVADPLRRADLTAESLYHRLATAGTVVQHAQERLTPAALTAPLARLLQQPEGFPVFQSDRVTFDVDGTAVVFDRATINGEQIEIRMERAATSLTMQWTDTAAK